MSEIGIALNARKMQECIERLSLVMGKQVSEVQAMAILRRMRSGMAQARKECGTRWHVMSKQERVEIGTRYFAEISKAEAALIRKRAALTVILQDRLNHRMDYYRARCYRGLGITQAILEDGQRNVAAVQNEYVTKFAAALDGKVKGLLRRFEDQRFAQQFVQELYGVDTGEKLAKEAAKVFSETSEALRQRFNAAGGNLAKLEHSFPQTHDTERMVHAAKVLCGEGRIRRGVRALVQRVTRINCREENKRAWVDYVMPKLDRNQYLDLYGECMSDADLDAWLGRFYDTIVAKGESDFDISTSKLG